jgi:hypothetical protein
MIQTYVLVTYSVRIAIRDTRLRIIAEYGSETVVIPAEKINEQPKIVGKGTVAFVEGPEEDFLKVIREVGELWITSHPMIGNWSQYLINK